MRKRYYRLSAGGAALVAAAALSACGSAASPAGTSASSAPLASSSASTTPAAQFNATDVAFTTGALQQETQSAALAALVPGHTTTAQLRQFAASLGGHGPDNQRMRDLMGGWHQHAPAPYTPGATPPAGTGPGMMGSHDWDEMGHEHGADFNDHWLDAMISNHNAEIALCRSELNSGASTQARALARSMLAQRQAELSQLQTWHHNWEHSGNMDSGDMGHMG